MEWALWLALLANALQAVALLCLLLRTRLAEAPAAVVNVQQTTPSSATVPTEDRRTEEPGPPKTALTAERAADQSPPTPPPSTVAGRPAKEVPAVPRRIPVPGGREPREPRTDSRVIEARLEQRCQRCFMAIHRGDRIRHLMEIGWCHAGCANAAFRAAGRRPPPENRAPGDAWQF